MNGCIQEEEYFSLREQPEQRYGGRNREGYTTKVKSQVRLAIVYKIKWTENRKIS